MIKWRKPGGKGETMKNFDQWKYISERWPTLTYYQRFESVVAYVLTFVIGAIVVVALIRLIFSVVSGLVFGVLNPLDQNVFQTIFGEIMTLLIALEFNHTLQYTVAREQNIIQTKIVLLIALLAVARKIIVIDLHDLAWGEWLGLAVITLALGITYTLIREPFDHRKDSVDSQLSP